MALTITIGGVDRTDLIQLLSIEVSDSVPARSDTMTFEMIITAADLVADPDVRPVGGNEIILTVDAVKEFGGEITTVDETHLINPDAYAYSVSCSDYARRLDRLLAIYQEIGPDLAGNIVKTVLTDFAGEFAVDLTDIQDGVVIPEQQYDYMAVTAILDQLANLSNYVWYVDFDKVVHFIPPPSFVSPLTGNIYDVDTDEDLGDLSWSEDISQIKNRVYLKDASVPDSNSRTDTFISDGVASFYKLFSEPEGVESTEVTSIKPDGSVTEWNVSLDPLSSDEGTLRGEAGTVYVCLINWGLRFPLLEDGKVDLEPNEILNATTTPMRQDLIFMVEDDDSQKMMADREGVTWGVNGGGVYEHVISLGDVRLGSQEAAEAYGTMILNQTAWPEVNGTFRTQVVGGWRAGQTFDLSSSKRDLYDAETYWKTAVKIDIPVWAQQVTKRVKGEPGGVILFETTVEFANRAIQG